MSWRQYLSISEVYKPALRLEINSSEAKQRHLAAPARRSFELKFALRIG